MAKHIVFQPVDLESDDSIKDTVLWGASFQVHPEIEVSRNYKSKEKTVVDRIKEYFPNFSWVADKKINE